MLSNQKTVSEVLKAAQEPIDNVIDTVSKLSQAASKMPYYKFNNMWSRQMQGAVGPSLAQFSASTSNKITVREYLILGLARRVQIRGWCGAMWTTVDN